VAGPDYESERAQLKLPLRKGHQPAKHPGRQELPVLLPRVEKIIPCTPEQCVCSQCGKDKELIGYETSEQLDVEPAKHFVLVTKREKRACHRCEELGVPAALPARIIPKSLVSDRVIIVTFVSKYRDHLPLFRQSAMLERESGLELSRVTLCGWVMAVGELLMPILGAMRLELLNGGYIQADETPLDVQSDRTKGKNHQPTCGNIAGLAERLYSISSWIVVHKVVGSSWENLTASCRPMGTSAMAKSGAKIWCKPVVGPMRGATLAGGIGCT
jgi:transposase